MASQEAMTLSRYLVEDSRQHRILFDFECAVNFEIFRSILKTLFKHFEKYSSEEFEQILRELCETINPKKLPVVDTFFKLYGIRGNYCNYQQLKNNFESNEISLSPREMNVIVLSLYRESKNLGNLNYKSLFKS